MGTDQYEDDIELDDELAEDADLELDVLDEDEAVGYDEDFVGDEPADENLDTDLDEDIVDDQDADEEEEDVAPDGEPSDEDDDDDVDELEEDEEDDDDEETLEVLLGPDSEATVTTPRSRSDDSGDAPPGEGEFTCRSCFLVKRRAQLADADAMICFDCA